MSDPYRFGWDRREVFHDPYPPMVHVAPSVAMAANFGAGTQRWLIVSPDVEARAREVFANDPLVTVKVQANLAPRQWFMCDHDGEITERFVDEPEECT